MDQKTLIITGMHRSGTSLITDWLSRCGLQIGERLVTGGIGNVDGHFEDVEFLKLHEEILSNNNLQTSGLVDETNMELSLYQLEKLKSIIKVKQQLYDQWGWKDPRTCLFLNTYAQLIPGAKYLVIARDYNSVVNSLLKRGFVEVDKKYMARGYISRLVWKYIRRPRRQREFYIDNAETLLKVWITYNEEILKALKKLPPKDYLVVDYNLLLEQDCTVFSFLTDKWKFALNYFDFRQVYKSSLMSKANDIETIVSSKTLLIKAMYLQRVLDQYMRNNYG
ncbi:MAG TPA: sulfotransferase [Mucilaginibacter sp.]|nr:sulfotransferase [Mucilaginibacter sp.]